MTSAAIWMRVSTADQHPENQRDALMSYAQRRSWDVVAEYSVSESAWKGDHRVMLGKAMEEARDYDVLIVWALDRLSREGVEATLALMRRFRERGVTVVSYSEPWTEADGEAGELLTAVIGWVARMESQRRSERVKAGLARRRAAGLPVGRQRGAKDQKPRKVSGYYARFNR